MPSFTTLADHSNAFARAALAKEILRSEQRRLSLMLSFLAVAFATYLGLAFTPGLMPCAIREGFIAQAPQVVALFCGAIFCEGLLLGLNRRSLREGRRQPPWARYAGVLIENSLPTAFLLVAATVFGPVPTLSAAPARFYFLFVIMATLHLDFALCIFGGAVAAAQYAATAFFLLHNENRAIYPPLLTDIGHQFAIAGLLLLAGLVAGFVAQQIHHQVVATLEAAEERNQAISVFGQYVSPQVVEKVLKQPVNWAGEVRAVSVIFVDIRNFSGFALHRTPQEVMAHLNVLFGAMVDVINQHNGIINKFLGDGFMAIFGAPADDEAHCVNAVNAGFALLENLERMNALGQVAPTAIGIGIHAGEVVTGNVGSHSRKEYTIIGDVVNLAARIESACKQFGARMLVSSEVVERLPNGISAQDLGLVDIKGQEIPLRLHRLA